MAWLTLENGAIPGYILARCARGSSGWISGGIYSQKACLALGWVTKGGAGVVSLEAFKERLSQPELVLISLHGETTFTTCHLWQPPRVQQDVSPEVGWG